MSQPQDLASERPLACQVETHVRSDFPPGGEQGAEALLRGEPSHEQSKAAVAGPPDRGRVRGSSVSPKVCQQEGPPTRTACGRTRSGRCRRSPFLATFPPSGARRSLPLQPPWPLCCRVAAVNHRWPRQRSPAAFLADAALPEEGRRRTQRACSCGVPAPLARLRRAPRSRPMGRTAGRSYGPSSGAGGTGGSHAARSGRTGDSTRRSGRLSRRRRLPGRGCPR